MTEPPPFPLTITRTGGIAGFQDVVVVTDDGLVSVTRKGREPRWFRLRLETMTRLAFAATEVPWSRISPDAARPAFPDDLVTIVSSPAGGPVRLPDSEVGSLGRVFHELLADLTRGEAGSSMFTPL